VSPFVPKSTGTVSGLKKAEMRLLNALQLIDDNNTLTKFGRNRSIQFLPLAAQCDALEIQLTTLELERKHNRVEDDAAEHLQQSAEDCTACEVGPFMAIFFCIAIVCLRELATEDEGCSNLLGKRFATPSIFSPAPTFEFEGRKIEIEWHDEKRLEEEFLKASYTIDLSHVESVLKNEYIGSYHEEKYPSLTTKQVANLFHSLERDQLVAAVDFFLKSPYQNRNGWPNLAIFDAGKIRLMEIKTGDKLHYNQIHTIPYLQNIFDDLSITKVRRVKFGQIAG